MMEASLPSTISSPSKGHESKRFRLRAVSHDYEVYERFFHKNLAKGISWTQLGAAVLCILLQMSITLILLPYKELWESSSEIVPGIWSSMFSFTAAFITLWACAKPTYCKLHSAMALHIIAMLVHAGLAAIIMVVGTWSLGNRIRELEMKTYDRYFQNGEVKFIKNGSMVYMPGRRDENTKILDEQIFLGSFGSAEAMIISMLCTSVTQSLLSFVMALMCGRSICCGRSHLEGRFLEMEAVGRDDADAILNFRFSSKEDNGKKPKDKLESVKSSGPPPYTPPIFKEPISPKKMSTADEPEKMCASQ